MRFRHNDRGVAPVIGFILIFAFLVATLGLYQTFIVPDQNADVELNHAAEIDNDFAQIHSGILNAIERNENYTGTIRTGVQYPARGLALNPPDPQGSLRTEEVGELTDVDDEFDTDDDGEMEEFYTVCDESNPTTKRLVFDPNYQFVGGQGVHTFENSVTSQNVDGNFAEYKQALVRGDTIHLRPIIAGSIDRTSGGSESIEFRSGKTGVFDYNSDDSWTLELPTKLTQPQWNTIADDNPKIASASVSGDTVDVTFQDGQYTIKCTPLGVNEDPNNSPNIEQSTSSGPDDPADTLNPAGPVILTESATSGKITGGGGMGGGSITCEDDTGDCIVKLQLNHVNEDGDDWEIKQIRYHYYTSPAAPGTGGDNNPPSMVEIYEEDTPDCNNNNYEFQAEYNDAEMFGTIEAGDTKTLYLDFRQESSTYQSVQGDGTIITMELQNANNPDDVEYLTYFASLTHKDGIDTNCLTSP